MKNKYEFKIEDLENYFENLTPGEKGCMSMNVHMSIQFVLDMYNDDELEKISLAELISYVVTSALDDQEQN